MSVIFDQLDVSILYNQNIQHQGIKFTQALKLGASLYYIANQNLKRVVTSDNSFEGSEAMDVLSNVVQICTDGKLVYCLQSNGDLYSIDQQPKLLVQNKNYIHITPTTAIDHSGKGFYWKTSKQIYSHCKHISTYKDKLTLITIGGKILNIENDAQVPIQQLNGLGVNGYFKKSVLFHFGGIAITENGDAYCFTQKMIKLKISNLDDISANSRFIFAVQGKYILQWNVEDFQNHQFYINQSLFKKMNYGHEISINCKKKEFQEIKFIFADQFSTLCCGQLRTLNKVNDQSSILERTFCRSSVSTLKQQLFDQWDPPQKKKVVEQRQGRYARGGEKTERSDASNRMTDRNERKEEIQISSTSSLLDLFFDRSNTKESETKQPNIQIDTSFKLNSKSKSEIPLEITKLPLLEKPQIIEEQKQQEQVEPNKLLEQQKKQFEQLTKGNTEQTIEQSTDQSKENIVEQQQQIISQKLQSIREIYDQPRFKTQNNSLYTLDEESSVEQSMCQDEEERPNIKRKLFNVNDIFDKPVQKQTKRISSNDLPTPTLSLENSIVQQQIQQIIIPELPLSNLGNLLSKISLKPEKSIDAVLNEQQKQQEVVSGENTSSFRKIEEPEIPKQKQIKSFLKIDQIQNSKQKKTVEVMDQQSVIDYQNNSDFFDQQHDSFMQILQSDKSEKKIDTSKIQNIMQIFDQVTVPTKIKKSPKRINMFKKQEQQENLGQLDENLIEVINTKPVLVEKQNEQPIIIKQEKKNTSPIKHEHKTLITFSEEMSQDQEDRLIKIEENRRPIKMQSPQKENQELIKLYPIEIDEQKVLKQVNKPAEIKNPIFEQPKQSLSRIKIPAVTCASSRPEKNFTPLRSKRNSTARSASIETNRFKKLEIDTQIPEQQIQTPQIFEELDLSNAMYHVNQTEIEDTRRTPVAQVIDVMNQQQRSQKKEPTLTRVSSTSQIPPSIRTNSIGVRRTEVSPIRVLANVPVSRKHEDVNIKMKRRQQDIILRKLFFRLDIHIKLAKLEFMFNLKQKAGK